MYEKVTHYKSIYFLPSLGSNDFLPKKKGANPLVD